jgi:hypothetical protein
MLSINKNFKSTRRCIHRYILTVAIVYTYEKEQTAHIYNNNCIHLLYTIVYTYEKEQTAHIYNNKNESHRLIFYKTATKWCVLHSLLGKVQKKAEQFHGEVRLMVIFLKS